MREEKWSDWMVGDKEEIVFDSNDEICYKWEVVKHRIRNSGIRNNN